jgi:hypothetical protein
MTKSLKEQQLCSSYELFYRLLFDCDLTREREERARYLLQVLHQLDAMGNKVSRRDFGDMVRKAILACGFDDEIDAWEALTQLVDPVLLMDPDSFSTLPADRNGPN